MNSYGSKAAALFEERFGLTPQALLFAPGRVNLIGEHIDYNGGRVMPCTLSVGTYAAASRRDDGLIRLVSADMEGQLSITVRELCALPQEASAFTGFSWGAYPLGVWSKLRSAGYEVGGFDMAVTGSLPRGSGLSSSASLEVLTCAVLDRLYVLGLDGVEAALLSLAAEHDCAGVNCGIMDQFICSTGRAGSAVLLDTSTLDYGYLPFETGECTLLIMNTRKPRRLVESKYNERRAECERALALLNRALPCPVRALCELDTASFENASSVLDPVLYRRARHVVYENARTLEAREALLGGDMAKLGRLLDASHDSLRDDYEVTGRELDSIVNAARAQDGVIGARMTGAGFGGCAIALVRRDAASAAAKEIARIYNAETGFECEIFPAETADAPFCGRNE